MSVVTTRRVGSAAVVQWNRPERRNAMDSELATDLSSALSLLAEDETCGVVVLEPEGPVFCAGWDLAELQGVVGASPDAARDYYDHSLVLFDVLDQLPQLLVAVVRGAAMGYGAGLAARSDVVLASEGAVFGFPEVRVGIVPALAALDALRALGPRTGLGWLATGEQFTARQAQASGLVARVVDDAAMEQEALALTERLSSLPAAVVRATKAFVNDATQRPDTARERAVEVAVEALASEEVAARVDTFMDRGRSKRERTRR